MRILAAVVATCAFAGCMVACAKAEKTPARIFERKHLPENKLQIRYHYIAGGTQYTDSIIIENHVIENDTIYVVLDANNPGKSTPDFIK